MGCNIYRVRFDGGEAGLWVGVIGSDGFGYGFDWVENGGVEDGQWGFGEENKMDGRDVVERVGGVRVGSFVRGSNGLGLCCGHRVLL